MNYKILDIGVGDGKKYPVRSRAVFVPTAKIILCDKSPSTEKNIVFCDVEKGVFPSGLFDEVYLSHVLEHTRDPLQVLKNIHGIMRCSGKIHVFVPSRLHINSWSDPDHRHIFSSFKLYRLMKQSGFTVSFPRSPIFVKNRIIRKILVGLFLFMENFFDEIYLMGKKRCREK